MHFELSKQKVKIVKEILNKSAHKMLLRKTPFKIPIFHKLRLNVEKSETYLSIQKRIKGLLVVEWFSLWLQILFSEFKCLVMT